MPSDAEIDALIERLTEAANLRPPLLASPMLEQAAAFLAALRDERDILADRIRVLDPLLKERCDEAQNFYERADKAETHVRELEQKLERARAALEPFYNISMSYTDLSDDVYVFDNGKRLLSVADFRRARATLEEIGQQE